MKQHRYKITVEKTVNADGTLPEGKSSFSFEANNHDDLAEVVDKVQQRGDLDGETAIALAVGIKLFGEVMLDHRDNDLFSELAPHFKDFMKKLKARPNKPL